MEAAEEEEVMQALGDAWCDVGVDNQREEEEKG